MTMLKEFKDFLLKQNVVALAIAVVVGTALNTLVKALVDDFIMPIVVAIGPGGDWQKATWTVGTVKFGTGDFVAAVINFLIIGLVAWRISKIFVKSVAETPKKNCPYCRMPMDRDATRCPHCTSQLAAA
ncbi:MAG: large conductance mechanosensitive channel [Gemmatimonadaceae bacterium]|nr:large conductance mechanosensitive channel [Gemmatimonadaceae bacterium]